MRRADSFIKCLWISDRDVCRTLLGWNIWVVLLLHLPFPSLCPFSHLASIRHLLFFSPPPPSFCHLSSCPSPPAASVHSLLICCHFSEVNGMPMGQIQLDQIKEMLLNSLTRQKEHTHASDMPKGDDTCTTNTVYTHRGKQTHTLQPLQYVKESNANH